MKTMAQATVAELVKLFTLRAVRIVLITTTMLLPLYALLTTPSTRDAILNNDPSLAQDVAPETVGLDGIELGQIAVIVLGVVAASSEYQSGQLKISLVAVPNRTRLMVAKTLAVLLASLLMGMVIVPAVVLISQCLLGELSVIQGGIPVSLLWRMGGAVVSWVALTLISFFFTMVLRQALVPLLIMLLASQLTLVMVHLIPGAQYLPFSAGVQLYDAASIVSETPTAALSPITASVVLLVWVAVLMVLASVLFQRRGVRA